MHPMNRPTAANLRKANRILLKAALADIESGIDIEKDCNAARQKVLDALRKLDPGSAKNPPPEEIDVAKFNLAAEGAGTMLIEKIQGRQGGSRN